MPSPKYTQLIIKNTFTSSVIRMGSYNYWNWRQGKIDWSLYYIPIALPTMCSMLSRCSWKCNKHLDTFQNVVERKLVELIFCWKKLDYELSFVVFWKNITSSTCLLWLASKQLSILLPSLWYCLSYCYKEFLKCLKIYMALQDRRRKICKYLGKWVEVG